MISSLVEDTPLYNYWVGCCCSYVWKYGVQDLEKECYEHDVSIFILNKQA